MKRSMLILLLLAGAAQAQAQMFKCVLPSGKVEYRGSQCDDTKQSAPIHGAVSDVPAMPAREMQRAQQARRAEPEPGPQMTVIGRSPSSRRVPTEQEIKNLETSASSITIGEKERRFLQDEVRRAKAARETGTEYSEQQLRELKEAASSQSRLSQGERASARRDAEAVHMESGTAAVKAQILQDREIEAQRAAQRQAAAARPQPTTQLHGCTSSGCFGSDGFYMRSGDTLLGPNGRSCTSTGGGWYSCR
jgi:hypothetical protein